MALFCDVSMKLKQAEPFFSISWSHMNTNDHESQGSNLAINCKLSRSLPSLLVHLQEHLAFMYCIKFSGSIAVSFNSLQDSHGSVPFSRYMTLAVCIK